MTVYAFELSEELELPVLLRPTTRVSHARADVDMGKGKTKKSPTSHEFVKNPARWVALPAHARQRHSVLLDKQNAINLTMSHLINFI